MADQSEEKVFKLGLLICTHWYNERISLLFLSDYQNWTNISLRNNRIYENATSDRILTHQVMPRELCCIHERKT